MLWSTCWPLARMDIFILKYIVSTYTLLNVWMVMARNKDINNTNDRRENRKFTLCNIEDEFHFALKTRHVFVKHGCPWRQQSQNMAKISKSYILTQPHPQGQVMSVKCEEPIDELTVQVWLLYDHPNFKYCTLFVSGTELRTDG